jgi:hypothetical protein
MQRMLAVHSRASALLSSLRSEGGDGLAHVYGKWSIHTRVLHTWLLLLRAATCAGVSPPG